MKKKGPEIVAPLVRQLPQVAEDDVDNLLTSLRAVILEARRQVLTAVDVVQVRTGWTVGRHIVEFEQGGQSRAAYGKAVLARVSARLTAEFGKGFDVSNLRYMRLFYQAFPKCDALRHELSWTHYRLLLRVDSPAAREWYMNEAAAQNWNTRALERQIGTLYYERLLASKYRQPLRDEAAEKLAGIQSTPREFIRDPVMLEFLGLPGTGKFDLKTRELTHQDIGQMDMYVRLYDDQRRGADDGPTVGIILCAHKDHTVVRYSVLDGNEQLFASKYKLILPSEEELKAELLREQALIATQALANSADAPAPRASKPKRKTKGTTA